MQENLPVWQGILTAFGFVFAVFVALIGLASIMVLVQRVLRMGGPALPVFPLQQRYREPLQKYSLYYQKLDRKFKGRFERKVQYFISTKHFVPRNFRGVTAEMKSLISASAVQLTFGLPNVSLSHFRTIVIYPDQYYSTINRVYHKGEVNPSLKLIVLSWKSFVEGYMNPKNGRNLGLHEMAHALHLENKIPNNDYGFFDEGSWNKFQQVAEKETADGTMPEGDLFRKYGGTNPYEFFAVAVENFFERSEEFKIQKPDLYGIMVGLLRQDPIKLLRL